jgi:hypothetical protein
MFEWLENHGHDRLLDAYCWFRYRLFGRCWAQGCPVPGRHQILHGPRQLDRCVNTPLAIVITEAGYARLLVAEAEQLTTDAADAAS